MSQRHALPLHQDSSSRFVPFLIGLMLFFGCLSLAATLILNDAADDWQAGLAGSLTLQAPADPAPNERAQAISLAVDLLRSAPGITSARAIPTEEMQLLLSPWLGQEQSLTNLPLPRMIDATIDADSPPDFADLQSRLEELLPGIVIDDHSLWLDKMVSAATLLRVIALLVLGLVLTAMVLTVIFAVRAGLSTHHETISLIHAMGATDGWLASLFERHAVMMAAKGVIAGLALALTTLAALGFSLSQFDSGLVPDIALGWIDWVVILILPVIAVGISWLTARLTVLAVLSREP